MSAPVIGAAMAVGDLACYRDWLIEKDRDLELQDFASPELLISGDWQSLVDEARHQLDGWSGRLGIHGPFWGLTLSNPDPEIRGVIRKRMLSGLDVCAALGASHMVVHSPYTTWDNHNIDNYPDARARVIEAAHDCLAKPVRRAGNQGVTLVIENIEDIDPRDRLNLADSFGSEAVKLSIDTGHAHYAHGSTGAPPVDYYVRAAGERLAHVHLQDADGYADRHWAIGQGTIRWHAVFAALAELRSAPRLVLELRDKAGIPASMAYLEREGLGV